MLPRNNYLHEGEKDIMKAKEVQNHWICMFDLENTQEDYASFLRIALWIENDLSSSANEALPFQEHFIPFRISRAEKTIFPNCNTLLALESRFNEKDSKKYSNITSANMFAEGLKKAGGTHTFNYYLRIHINNSEIDIAELQYLILTLQALPNIQNRVAIRLMESSNALWTTNDYFHISNYLRFVQERYGFFYACYDANITSLRSISKIPSGVQSTFLPVLEVDNQLCQLLNKSWKLADNFNGQSFDKLHTALIPHGCTSGDMTWTLFQIGLRMLFDSIPGKNYITTSKKKELLSFLINLVQGMQGITPLDMLLFGALVGDKLKTKKEWDTVRAYMGNIQTFSLAISQILENAVNHSEHNLGVFTFRLQRNTTYLNSHYPGYAHSQNSSSLEVMIADSNNTDGIVDHFLKSSKADTLIKTNATKVNLSHLFGNFQDPQMETLWSNARQLRPEMCHGLLSFFTSVQTLKGAVRVRSVPQFKIGSARDMFYYSGTQCSDSSETFLENTYVPGTQFSIVVNRPVSLSGLKTEEEWEFDFDTLVYATTYHELAQALRFDEHVYYLPVQKNITSSKRFIQSQMEKDTAASEWKKWFDDQCKELGDGKHIIFQCDLESFCQELEKFPALGEPFCKGLLSSCFFNQSKEEKKKNYFAVLFQNPSAQFSRFFAGTLQVMAKHEHMDFSHISVYFYPKQYRSDDLPYCATTLHQLLGLTINEKEFPRIFPYTLFIKGESGHCLFEDELYNQANTSIYKSNQGFKISQTHMRLGNKVHIDTFYEMALFFENPNYAYYTAFLLLRTLLRDYSSLIYAKKHLLLYGYASYSRAIVWALHQILEEYWKIESSSETKTDIPTMEFVIYQSDLKLESEQPQIQMYYSRSEWQHNPSQIWDPDDTALIMIVPISSSLTTFNKMKAELDRETHKTFLYGANFTAFWVRNHFEQEGEPTAEENYFWESCDPSKKTIKSHLVSGNIHYLRSATSQWKNPLECECCFPDDSLLEYPLVETDPTSTIPTQQFYLEPSPTSPPAKTRAENDARVARLKGNVLYGHISKGGNHYQYFIKPRAYFLQERKEITRWLIELRDQTLKHDPNILAPNRINVLIIPQQIDNVEFGQYVYEHYFQAHAECVVINTEKEFRSNLQAEYSGLFQRLSNTVKTPGQTVKFYYVDNSVCSGNSFTRAVSLIGSCMNVQVNSNPYEFHFEKVFLLISRLSEASKRMYIKDPSQNFHAYVELQISSMRTFGDSCIPCKIQREAQQYYKKAATKDISSYWEKKAYTRRCISFDQFELPTTMASNQPEKEQQEDGYRRMICSHRASFYIKPVQGKEEGNYFLAIRGFLEELCTVKVDAQKKNISIYQDINDGNRKEWISAGLKVLARPFFTFDYRLRCVVMDLFLLLSEFLINNTTLDTIKNRLENTAKSYLLECKHLEWCEKFAHDLLKMAGDNLFQQLVFIRNHVLKGLADIKSNYILRQDTMVKISRRLSEAALSCNLSTNDISEFYDHYLRSILRIIHSSSDETKGVWLEHLLQYGQEYPNTPSQQFDGIDHIVAQIPENIRKHFQDFLEILLVENNRPIYQAVVEFSKHQYHDSNQKIFDQDTEVDTFLNEYHMRSAKTFLSYGYNVGTSQQLCVLVNLLQPEGSKDNYKHRYQSLGENLKTIVCTETESDKEVVLFGENTEIQSPIAKYLNMVDYFTLFPTHLRETIGQRNEPSKPAFERPWNQIKNDIGIQADLRKNGFALMTASEDNKKYDIIIKLDNNYDDITATQRTFPAKEVSLQKQKIDPIFIYIPCALLRQKALGLTRKIMMFRCKLIEWLEKDFNNNAIAVLSQQQHIAKLLSTDKMGDHAENDFVECQQLLLLATDETDFEKERKTGNWEYAANIIGQPQNLYVVPNDTKAPLSGYLSKVKDWFFLRSYVNSRISRLFRTMVRTANEMEDGNIIDAENYYARDDQSVLMRPVYDLKTVFFTPIKPGYIRKNYLEQMLEVITFEIEGEKDYGENSEAKISTRMDNLSQQLGRFICINLQSKDTQGGYAYLSEYLAAILLDCFISGVKAGTVWNQEGWGGEAYCELSQKNAWGKCQIEIFREYGSTFEGYNFDYLVIRNEIHHPLRSEKKGPGMSQAAIRWYIEGLWRSCFHDKKQYPEVIAKKLDNTYTIKLPILKREGDTT